MAVPAQIRPERAGDEPAIHAVHMAAFGREAEAAIVDAVRASPAWLPGLSLVAEVDGLVVGHVLVARATVERPDALPMKALVLGPIGVAPEHQGQGIGSALMRRAIGAALARAEPVIALLGDPALYSRFGFEPARAIGLEPPAPWPDANWMALRLPAWTPELHGILRYPTAFPLD